MDKECGSVSSREVTHALSRAAVASLKNDPERGFARCTDPLSPVTGDNGWANDEAATRHSSSLPRAVKEGDVQLIKESALLSTNDESALDGKTQAG